MEETNHVDEIDLREVFSVLRRRLALLFILPLLAGIAAAAFSIYVSKPVYRASTTLWVIKQQSGTIDYTTLLTNRNLVKTYAEVAKSRVVMEEVIDTLKLVGMTPDALQSKLTVSPVRDTEIIELAVTDGNPIQAAAIADAVATSFMGQLSNFVKLENVAIVDRAFIPGDPIKPRPVMNTAIAAVLGLMAALGLAFLLEYMDTSIRTMDDLVRAVNLPALGCIPKVDLHRVAAAARKAEIKGRAAPHQTTAEGEVPVAE